MNTAMDFCAIDFETACNNSASACAVGVVRMRDGEVAATYYSLIRPPEGMEILPRFTDIHGITNSDVSAASNFKGMWPGLREFIGKDFLVAHNSSFDRGVLNACLDHYMIDWPIPRFECTVRLSRRAWPSLPNHKLDTVSEFLGIDLIHHEALSDALACAKIWVEAQKIAASR